MSEANSPLDWDRQSSSLVFLNVADQLRLMSAEIKSVEIEQQLEQIADIYDQLVRLCANFKNLKPGISITGPILPDS
jgi:hypothetical protein